jgi:hypothetical protein
MEFSKKDTTGLIDLSLLASKYTIEGDRFIIDSFNNPAHPYWRLSEKEREDVVKYSQGNNKIVEIFELSKARAVTAYYKDYMPLVIIKECNFYPREMLVAHVEKYLDFILCKDNGKQLYKRIADEMVAFAKQGYVFEDQGANNILVNSDFTDFRIIDVQSISHVVPMAIEPVRILLTGKYVRDGWGHKSDPLLRELLTPHIGRLKDMAKAITEVQITDMPHE